jgi:hypothetical protein
LATSHAADNPARERPVEDRVGGSEEEAAIMPGAASLLSFQGRVGMLQMAFVLSSRGVFASLRDLVPLSLACDAALKAALPHQPIPRRGAEAVLFHQSIPARHSS